MPRLFQKAAISTCRRSRHGQHKMILTTLQVGISGHGQSFPASPGVRLWRTSVLANRVVSVMQAQVPHLPVVKQGPGLHPEVDLVVVPAHDARYGRNSLHSLLVVSETSTASPAVLDMHQQLWTADQAPYSHARRLEMPVLQDFRSRLCRRYARARGVALVADLPGEDDGVALVLPAVHRVGPAHDRGHLHEAAVL